MFFIQTSLIRYGGDWHGDSLDLLVEALGPRLTRLQLHYVENFDLAAIATVAHCCQQLKSLEVAALVGSRYVGEDFRGGALHCTDQEDGGDRGGKVVVFVKSNVSAEEDTGSTVGAGGGGSGGTLQLKRARHPALAWDQPP